MTKKRKFLKRTATDQRRPERQPRHRATRRRLLQPVPQRGQHLRQRTQGNRAADVHRPPHPRSSRLVQKLHHRHQGVNVIKRVLIRRKNKLERLSHECFSG
jgi:hypothetical protein